MLYENCENDYVCETLESKQEGYLWYVDYENSLSLFNWIKRLNMHCSDPYLIGLFGSYEFIGTAMACLIFPPIADTYGRRFFSISSMWITMGVMLTLMIFSNHYVYYAALLVNGICIGLK